LTKPGPIPTMGLLAAWRGCRLSQPGSYTNERTTTTVNSTCSYRQRRPAVAWGCTGDRQAARSVGPAVHCAPDGLYDDLGPTFDTDCGAAALIRLAYRHRASLFSGPPFSIRWPVLRPVTVRSISTEARDTLRSGETRVRELARFGRAIDLVVGESLVALVVPEIGNGPFHAVVDHLPESESPWRIGDGELTCGPWRIAITPETVVWDPRPQWSSIVIEPHSVQAVERIVSELAGRSRSRSATQEALDRILAQRIADLARAIAGGHPTDIQRATSGLAGLGSGLTPYGDDVLAGAVLALWAAHHPGCSEIGAMVARAAAPATHALSRAFIDAASRGMANADWHVLLDALSRSSAPDTDRAARRIAATGDMSGVAMLRGFIAGYRAGRRDS